MAQQYVTTDGTLIIPGSYAKVSVAQQNAGLAVSGVIALVGEADSGPAWTQETADLQDVCSFGPGQVGAVVAKFGSGRLVDAFRAAVEASNDPNIIGAPSQIICIKTNAGTQASAALNKVGGGTYGTLYTLSRGRNGNQLSVTVSAPVTETAPATGSFTWINNVGTSNVSIRTNGAAVVSLTLSANRTPAQFVTAWNSATTSDPLAAGGAARTTAQSSVGTLTLTALGSSVVTVAYSGTFTTTPSVGDTMEIPLNSVIKTASTLDNVGAYVITAATSSLITATKLSDGAKTAAVPGTITPPVTTAAIAVSGTVANDILVSAPVTITAVPSSAINGIGKSLEIAELATGTDLVSRSAYALSTTAVTWVSTAAVPAIIGSATEASSRINLSRANDNTDEQITGGGVVGLTVSYLGTTCTMSITSTALTTTHSGGLGGDLSLVLADYATISDLAAYINAQTGYSAAAATATVGQLPSTALDRVTTVSIGSTWNAKNGRIKVDAYKMFQAISQNSSTVQLGSTAARADLGLPAVNATVTYFAGGKKGSTSNALATAAIDALANLSVNFVVPLFSQDASTDIAAGLTQGLDTVNGEVASTYTVDSINAWAKSHCLAMSKLKRKKNRQAIVSKRDTFNNAKIAAANLATARVACTFQDIKNTNSSGDLVQFQPWLGAAVAAGMQTAGFYRAIVHKFANVSGVVQGAGDFNDRDDDAVEAALLSGLLPMKRHPNGGYFWVSDQTTYTKDSNFVYNSLQAVYAADIIALTTAQRMEDAFVGQSVADISAAVAMTFLKGIMADFMRLKLIAPSSDALAGFKNASITIAGPVMLVEAEVKLAGAIYFVPISFLVSPVVQTANQ